MKKDRRNKVFFGLFIVAVAALLILGCAMPVALSKATEVPPTSTASNTPQPSDTATLVDTNTPEPTLTDTPVPPTAIPEAYVIDDTIFAATVKADCATDVGFDSVEGDSFGVKVLNGSLSIINGEWAVWCYGAKHTWFGTLTFKGYTFTSDEKAPLQFQIDPNLGYVYLTGSGTVKLPDGTIVSLPIGSAAESVGKVVGTATQAGQVISSSDKDPIAAALNGATVNETILMDEAHTSAWYLDGSAFNADGLLVGGSGPSGTAVLMTPIRNGEAFNMTFEVDQSVDVGIGLTHADNGYSFQFTIAGADSSFFAYDGKDVTLGDFSGSLKLQPKTSYQVLVAVDTNGKFVVTVWDPAKPGKTLVGTFQGDKTWKDLDFSLTVTLSSGTLLIKELSLLKFESIK
jgi:hypothetical protein